MDEKTARIENKIVKIGNFIQSNLSNSIPPHTPNNIIKSIWKPKLEYLA
jgi:hypothetical protein